MSDELLKIEKAEPFQVAPNITFEARLKAKGIIALGKEKQKDDDKDFKETLLIDEVLEAENNG